MKKKKEDHGFWSECLLAAKDSIDDVALFLEVNLATSLSSLFHLLQPGVVTEQAHQERLQEEADRGGHQVDAQ